MDIYKYSLFIIFLFSSISSQAQDQPSQHTNGKYGYKNESGEWAIRPKFNKALAFSNGLAAAYDGKHWGFINKKGKWVLRKQKMVHSFHYGLAAVKSYGSNWKYISPELYSVCSQTYLTTTKTKKIPSTIIKGFWGRTKKTTAQTIVLIPL
ncbi:MAG: WG repeat-containing protein [Aureispira sp.]|nr:WG repeat-containing protein [Aureispira sp.]